MSANHHRGPGVWLGLLLILVGGGLLARELGYLPPQVTWVDFWPLVLVAWGLSSLLQVRGFVGALLSLSLLTLGSVLLATNLGFMAFPAARLWPGLLVLLGVAFLLRAARGAPPTDSPPTDSPPTDSPPRDPADEAADELREVYDEYEHYGQPHGLTVDDDRLSKQIMFSGLAYEVQSQAWKGGELNVIAGGVDLDLRHARLDPAGARLDVRVVMGGIDIRVPDTWRIVCDVTPLLGGADNMARTTQGSPDAPTLRLVGSVTLGGLSIRN
jgi:hypothetical protein